jgi:hypothetical protein
MVRHFDKAQCRQAHHPPYGGKVVPSIMGRAGAFGLKKTSAMEDGEGMEKR